MLFVRREQLVPLDLAHVELQRIRARDGARSSVAADGQLLEIGVVDHFGGRFSLGGGLQIFVVRRLRVRVLVLALTVVRVVAVDVVAVIVFSFGGATRRTRFLL